MRPRDSKDRARDAESTTNVERASVTTALGSSADGNDSRISRVVAMVMSPAASFPMREASSSGAREEDVVTTVDGAREALTEEQHAALARRIRLAMEHRGLEQTLPLGTPSPAPVQPISFIAPPPNPSPAGPSSVEHAPLSFKKTMLLGLPRLSTEASPSLPSVAPVSPSVSPWPPSVRASVVREVGPPRTPPPRRSRRVGAVYTPDARDAPDVIDATDLTATMDAELEPLDHDAFQLDHRIVSPEAMFQRAISEEAMARQALSEQALSEQALSEQALSPGLVNRQAWLDSTPAQLARGAGLILPPPPGPRDLEPPSPAGRERPSSLLERLERSEWSGAYREGSLRADDGARGAAHDTPALGDLPSVDPFAGFIVPPPRFVQRWVAVIVIALAVVGVFALAALAVWWLTNPAS